MLVLRLNSTRHGWVMLRLRHVSRSRSQPIYTMPVILPAAPRHIPEVTLHCAPLQIRSLRWRSMEMEVLCSVDQCTLKMLNLTIDIKSHMLCSSTYNTEVHYNAFFKFLRIVFYSIDPMFPNNTKYFYVLHGQI